MDMSRTRLKIEAEAEAEAEPEDPNLRLKDNLKAFLIVHYKGLICIFVPIICIGVLLPFPPEPYQWTEYCYLAMLVFWVTECIPLAVTSLLPLVLFPFTGIRSTVDVCRSFYTDSIFMYIGSLILAASVEQSGLHKRIAFIAIRSIGYSHVKLLVTMVAVTTFISMWIPNASATALMLPVIFAVLKVFEDQNLIKIYETTEDGDKIASDITTCYFCTATFASTIGGIGTFIGTGSHLNFKIAFHNRFPAAPEYLSFPLFSVFGIPYMIVLDAFMILYILVVYVGFLRPNSAAAIRAKIPLEGLKAAEATVNRDYEALGKLTFWEFMVILLFGGAIVLMFCRSPIIFRGWSDAIQKYFGIRDKQYIRDSSLVALVAILMLLLPSNLSFFNNCKAKVHEELPTQRVPSVVHWKTLMAKLPFSFVFLLGAGTALFSAVGETRLNMQIFKLFKPIKSWPNKGVLLLIIMVGILLSNVASANRVAIFWTEISMKLAMETHVNPFLYVLASGFSASFSFMLPIGNAENVIVKSCAKIPTSKMVKAGFGPTITTIIITWHALYLYAPIVWPDLNNAEPAWIK